MESNDGSTGRAGIRAVLKFIVLLTVIAVGVSVAFLRSGPSPSPAQVPVVEAPERPAPEPAASLLRERPELRLARAADVRTADRGATANRPEGFNPITQIDGTGDNVPDMFVILVNRDRPAYSLAWFKGRPGGFSSEPVWILRDANEPLIGVQVADLRLTPLFCRDCDSNPIFRWSGEAFEIGLRFKGEGACVTDGTPFFERPDERSLLRHRAAGPLFVRILAVGARASDFSRWHRVTLETAGNTITAYVDGRQFMDSPGC